MASAKVRREDEKESFLRPLLVAECDYDVKLGVCYATADEADA